MTTVERRPMPSIKPANSGRAGEMIGLNPNHPGRTGPGDGASPEYSVTASTRCSRSLRVRAPSSHSRWSSHSYAGQRIALRCKSTLCTPGCADARIAYGDAQRRGPDRCGKVKASRAWGDHDG